MTDEKETVEKPPAADKAEVGVKKRATRKIAPPRASRYIVAPGRALTTQGRIIDAGEEITAADVADIEALLKRGYVVKA
jgi:hypothetical protein